MHLCISVHNAHCFIEALQKQIVQPKIAPMSFQTWMTFFLSSVLKNVGNQTTLTFIAAQTSFRLINDVKWWLILGWSFSLSVRCCKDREDRSLSVCMNVTQIETFKPANAEQTASSEIFMTPKNISGRVPDDPLFETDQTVCFWSTFSPDRKKRRDPTEEGERLNYWSVRTSYLKSSDSSIIHHLNQIKVHSTHTVIPAEGTDYERENEANRWTGDAKQSRFISIHPIYSQHVTQLELVAMWVSVRALTLYSLT